MDIELDELELRYERLRAAQATRLAGLTASLAQCGQLDPVLVVRHDEQSDGFVLIDGYARVRALRQLGKDVVRAVVLDLDAVAGLVLAWRLEVRGRRSALEDGWLITELIASGWHQRKVAARLQRSHSWVSRRLALVQALPDAVQQAIRVGRVPAYAAAKYLVPLARANAGDCETIVAGLADEPVSVRQVERLYMGYKLTDEVGRARIVQQPRLFLRAEQAAREEPKLDEGDPAKPLVDDLDAITGLSRRARRRLQEGLLDELDQSRRQLVDSASQEARLAFKRLRDCLGDETCSISTPEPPS
jgi:ParB/RepB/Spo0J family partition protein